METSLPTPCTTTSTLMAPTLLDDIPEDIWVEIFKCSAAAEGGARPFDIHKAGKEARWRTISRTYPLDQVWHAPWSLVWVCRQWRRMALAHPELWASVQIPIPSEVSSYQQQLQNVNKLMQSSGSWPLSIRFVSLVRQPCLSTLKSIFADNERCQSLTIKCRPNVMLFNLLRACPWPSLTTLNIGLLFTADADTPRELDLSFLPALQHVIEQGSSGQFVKLKVPLHDLKTLELHLPSPHVAFCFGTMPRLTRLTILVADPMAFDGVGLLGLPDGITDLKCPKLRQLHLKDCLRLLPLFEGAALETLTVETVFIPRGVQLLSQMLTASKATLREVELTVPFMLIEDRLIRALLDLGQVEVIKINALLVFDLAWQSFDWDTRYKVWTKGVCELMERCRVTASSHPLPLLQRLEVGYSIEGGEEEDPLFCESVVYACNRLIRDVAEPFGRAWESRALYRNGGTEPRRETEPRLVAWFTFKPGKAPVVSLGDEEMLELFADDR